MALIKCPECGKSFSDTASACPSCGYTKTAAYGEELGKGIKEGLKGLNTVCSPKKKATCIKLSLFPFIAMVLLMIGGFANNDLFIGIGGFVALLSGACNFYVGKFKKGVLYSITCGFFLVGAIIDLFKLMITNNFKDSNNFPVIY